MSGESTAGEARQASGAATLCGLAAVLLWSALVGLIRATSEHAGPIGGAALIYTLAAALLWLVVGRPRWRDFTPGYLLAGGALFAAYEVCFSLSLGYASDRGQAIEVGIVNYLWPCLTILLAIALNGQRARWPIVPGTLLALAGIAWVVGGEGGLSLAGVWRNVATNPLSYGLAFTGAVLWALYCNVTRRYARGQNGIVVFFVLTAVSLWIKYAISAEPAVAWSWSLALPLAAAGGCMAAGYGLWNVGILRGNMTLLATASYFTPVLSTALAALLLDTRLALPFWQGVGMVTAGSLLCWVATRERGHGR